jgi:hypothetical protein
MNTLTIRFIQFIFLVSSVFFFHTENVFAYTSFSNATLMVTSHPKPVEFTAEKSASSTIVLEGSNTLGVFRTSVNGIPLFRFTLDHAYWWVSPRGVIWGVGTHASGSTSSTLEASTDQEAYTVYLSML